MSIGARAASWWSAWKWVAILAAALSLSVWGNLAQWRNAAMAPLRDENRQLVRAIEDAEAIFGDNAASAARLTSEANKAAEQLAAAGTDYRRAARARPLSEYQCAPGQGRVDAVNRALGARGATP